MGGKGGGLSSLLPLQQQRRPQGKTTATYCSIQNYNNLEKSNRDNLRRVAMLLLIIIQLPTPFVILHRRRPRTLTVVTFNINFAGKAQINLETREDPLHTLDSGGGAGGGGAGEWWLWCWCWLQWCARRAQGPSSPVLDGQRTSAPPVSTQPPPPPLPILLVSACLSLSA